jgi:coenzyme F420-reducing hydrogenase delta subunit
MDYNEQIDNLLKQLHETQIRAYKAEKRVELLEAVLDEIAIKADRMKSAHNWEENHV